MLGQDASFRQRKRVDETVTKEMVGLKKDKLASTANNQRRERS